MQLKTHLWPVLCHGSLNSIQKLLIPLHMEEEMRGEALLFVSAAALLHITYTRRLLLTIYGTLVLHLLIFYNTCNALTSYFLAFFNSQNEQITRVLAAIAACSAAVQSVIFSTFLLLIDTLLATYRYFFLFYLDIN